MNSVEDTVFGPIHSNKIAGKVVGNYKIKIWMIFISLVNYLGWLIPCTY